MNDKQITELVFLIGFTIFLIFMAFFLVRLISLSHDISNSDVCEFEIGENWRYEYSQMFGKTCVEIDYVTLEIVNRTKFPYETNLEVSEKYCDVPKFFSLKNWNSGCSIPISDEVQT